MKHQQLKQKIGSSLPSKVPLNSCYTGEFRASQFAKTNPWQVTQIQIQTVVEQQESDTIILKRYNLLLYLKEVVGL